MWFINSRRLHSLLVSLVHLQFVHDTPFSLGGFLKEITKFMIRFLIILENFDYGF
jgi:hypothetical protein